MRIFARLALVAALVLATLTPVRAAAPENQIFQGTISTQCATFTGCPSGSFLGTTLSPPVLVSIQVTGTFVGTLIFEGGLDCQNYNPIPLTPAAGGGAVSSVTAAGLWSGIVINPTCFQIRATSWTSGTATVTMLTSTGFSSFSTGGTSGGSGGAITAPLDNVGNVKVAEQNNLNIGNFPAQQHVVCDTGCSPFSAWTYFPVPADATCVSAPCVIKGSAGTLAGIINLSTSPQPAGQCTLYDNSTTAAGQVLYPENQIGAGQVVGFLQAGIRVNNGIVIQCAANPGGNGLLVLYN